ncbi:MAG TPA: PKD domain-containing protein [Gaiellaceae bacterium]|nr:PKD domain-containing protein [Gaiellaceae bacterium]
MLALMALAVLVPAGALGVSGTDTITTIAGNGLGGFSGDGGQATSAQLKHPWGVVVDAQGSVYVGDKENNRVRKVSGGIITTVAGTGTPGYSGDGGQATSAQLHSPEGLALDADGSLYIADYANHRVRKLSGGIITTVAGTGTPGYSGDGGQATSAQLQYPVGVAVDTQGSLYIADSGNNRIRKVSGGIITTVAGAGTAGYSGDGGPAASAQLQSPDSVAVDAQGNLYIADSGNHRVRKVSGGIITTVAGDGALGFSGDGGQATSAQLDYPEGVVLDSQGNLYIADWGNNRVRKVSGGIITTIAGTGVAGFSGDGGPATSAQLDNTIGVAVDSQGSLFVADFNNNRLRRIENKLPIVDLNAAPSSGQAPLTVSFDGSHSSDPDGSIVSYQWSFGDGASASGATVSHRYSAGSYTAKLTITDDSGGTASVTRQITANSPPPPPPPPPPSPPPTTKPKLRASKASFVKAVAGKAFRVSIAVTNSTTGKGVRGRVLCIGRLEGRPLPSSHRWVTARGTASCTWQLPKMAAGKQFSGSIAETYKGARVRRSFTTHVAQGGAR